MYCFHYAKWDNVGKFLSTENSFNVVKCLVLDHYSEIETVFDDGFNAWQS